MEKLNMKKVDFVADIKEAINVALFKDKVMHHVAGDKNKNISALLILIVAALASALGMQFFGGIFAPGLVASIGMMIYQVISSVIGIFVLSFVAKSIFKGTAKHDAFFRVMAFAMIISWVTIVPLLGIIAALWGLALVFVVLKAVHKLTTGGALGAMLVSIIAFALLSLILSPALAFLGINSYGGANFRGSGDFGNIYENGFEMNFNGEDGAGSFEMEDGKVTIKGPDGKVMEIEIPQ